MWKHVPPNHVFDINYNQMKTKIIVMMMASFTFLVQVVVKFISKARIVSDCWVDDPMLGRVSQEISILTRVQHHNIVKVTGLSHQFLRNFKTQACKHLHLLC